jgi:hypothetical protein
MFESQSNVSCREGEVKQELITGKDYLVTGRILAMVGEWSEKVTARKT